MVSAFDGECWHFGWTPLTLQQERDLDVLGVLYGVRQQALLHEAVTRLLADHVDEIERVAGAVVARLAPRQRPTPSGAPHQGAERFPALPPVRGSEVETGGVEVGAARNLDMSAHEE